jgi:CBS-domain-containing membrane protein
MQETQRHRLLVIDDDRRLVGIVSIADLVPLAGLDEAEAALLAARVHPPISH